MSEEFKYGDAKELLKGLKAGDREAMRQFCTQYGPRANGEIRSVLSMVPSARRLYDTNALLHSAIVGFPREKAAKRKACSRRKGTRKPSRSADKYLLTAVKNKALDILRSRFAAEKRGGKHCNCGDAGLDDAVGREEMPLEAAAIRDLVEAVLKLLTPSERLYCECRADGYTDREIEARFHIKVGRLRKSVARKRETLRCLAD